MLQGMANLTIQRGNAAKRQKPMGCARVSPIEAKQNLFLVSFFSTSRDGRLMMCTPSGCGSHSSENLLLLPRILAALHHAIVSYMHEGPGQGSPMSCALQRHFTVAIGIDSCGDTQAFYLAFWTMFT